MTERAGRKKREERKKVGDSDAVSFLISTFRSFDTTMATNTGTGLSASENIIWL
jgi:hypothetical protein